MPFRMGPTELIIILVIVLVLFGVGRIGKIGGELGKGIRAFRQGVKDTDKEGATEDESEQGGSETEKRRRSERPSGKAAKIIQRSRRCMLV